LEHKLGPILFQLPPNWDLDLERLEKFFSFLPSDHRYAFEFRNASWSVPETYDLLTRHNIAYCIFHIAGIHSPIQITADFAYVRLHGPGGKYQGSYSDTALGEWAERIRKWRRELKTIYVYFDNDDAAYAAQNALRLKELIASPVDSSG